MNEKPPLLSPLQRRLSAGALTCVAVAVIIAAIVALLWAAGWFVNVFSMVLWPLVIAAILSLLLRPCVRFFEKRLRLGRTLSILLLFVLALVGAFAVVAWILPVFLRQLVEFVHTLPVLVQNAQAYIHERWPDLGESVRHFLSVPWVQNLLNELPPLTKPMMNLSSVAFAKAGQTLVTLIAMGTGAALLPIYLFYFLDSDSDLTDEFGSQLTFLPPKVREDIVFLIREFRHLVLSFFRGQMLIGLIMGVLYGAGFQVAGLRFGLFLGLCLGFLNIIPYLGTITGVLFILPLSFFQTDGGWPVLLGVIGVFAVVQVLEGYYLTPKIMGKQTGLHPMLVIVSILFWGIALNGILGMVLAIPLTAFLITFWHLLRERYLPRYAADENLLAPPTVSDTKN